MTLIIVRKKIGVASRLCKGDASRHDFGLYVIHVNIIISHFTSRAESLVVFEDF